MAKSGYKASSLRTMIAIGVFTALAYVCCVLFHFKVSFLSFDLKDAVMTVAAMLFGPMYGLGMVVAVSLIEFVTISGTGVYGLIMNVISSTTFVCVGSAIYSHRRNFSGALIGAAASVVATVAVMMGANMLITPYYMHVSVDKVAAMIPTLLLPFNLTKALFNASLVFIIYKPLSSVLRRAGFVSAAVGSAPDGPFAAVNANSSGEKKQRKTSLVIVISAVIAAATLVFFFVTLGGSFEIGT